MTNAAMFPTPPPATSGRTLLHVLARAAVVFVALTATASLALAAPSAKSLYEAAVAREQRLEFEQASLKNLRAVVAAYQNVVHRYPRSGYSDNALWRAAGVSLTAFQRFEQSRDRTNGLRFLALLVSEYPSSSLVRHIDQRRSRFVGDRPARASAAAGSGLVTLRAIRRTTLPDVVRVILELDGEVAYREERLANPDRLFFDLTNVSPTSEVLNATRRWDDDVVRAIRLGRHPDNTTRVVLDLENVASYSVFAMNNPYRLVVDCERASPDARATSGVTATAASATAVGPRTPRVVEAPTPPDRNLNGKLSLARQLGLGVSRVVIDPGHGGRDPGARAGGMTEADLVLDIALRLEQLLLRQPGFDVVMVRRTDTFLALDRRTALANEAHADLFLSIHANAARDPRTGGIETYVLDFAQNPAGQAIAARENSASAATMGRLNDIVEAITLNNKLDESRDFAEMVQRSMIDGIRPHYKNVRDLGVKQAPFVVLIGAGMPSILAEVSFLTNRQEARLLSTDAHRQRIAEALLNGILKYQGSLKTVQTVSLQ